MTRVYSKDQHNFAQTENMTTIRKQEIFLYIILFFMLYFVVMADSGAGSAKIKRKELTEEQKKANLGHLGQSFQ